MLICPLERLGTWEWFEVRSDENGDRFYLWSHTTDNSGRTVAARSDTQ